LNKLIVRIQILCFYVNIKSIAISNMVCLNQKILYYIPDEVNSFCDCSLHRSVIQCCSKHYNHDYLKDIPCSLTNIITTYSNELFNCVNEFETRYRKLRHEFESKTHSIVVDTGV